MRPERGRTNTALLSPKRSCLGLEVLDKNFIDLVGGKKKNANQGSVLIQTFATLFYFDAAFHQLGRFLQASSCLRAESDGKPVKPASIMT